MNSDGDIYQGEPRSKDDIPLTGEIATYLRGMNRKSRRIYYAEKRAGKSDADALYEAQAVGVRR